MLPNKLYSYLTVNKSMRCMHGFMYYALSYVDKQTYMNTCVLYSSCFCDKIPRRKQLNWASVCLGSWLQTTFHPGGEITVARAWGSWSYCMQSGEAKGAHACARSFSSSGSVQGPSMGRGATHSGLGRPNAISLFQIILHRHAQMLFSQVILDLIKLTIHMKHHNTQRKKIMEAVYTNMRTSIVTFPWCNFSNEYVLLLYWEKTVMKNL